MNVEKNRGWFWSFWWCFLNRSKADFVTCKPRIRTRLSDHHSRGIRANFKEDQADFAGILSGFLPTYKRLSGRNPRNVGEKSCWLWIHLALESLQDALYVGYAENYYEQFPI